MGNFEGPRLDMEFRQLAEAPLRTKLDVLALCVFGEPTKEPLFKELDKALGGALIEAAKSESFEGKPQQVLTFFTGALLPARRVVLVGAGARGEFSLTTLRDVTAVVSSAAGRVNAAEVGFVVPHIGRELEPAFQLAVEGAVLGTYRFTKYLSAEDARKPSSIKSFGLFADTRGKKLTPAQNRSVKAAIERGEVVASAVCLARDFINEPAAAMTPAQLAAEAEAIAGRHKSLSIKVFGPEECAELGMGMFLAVGQGSDQEPRLIHMVYKPSKKAKRKVALVGKGITFDSGGYSLKPSQAMEDMKVDMSGAAAVIAAMDAIAQLGSDVEIHAIAACCENLVSGRAYKLGDVLKSMDGTTVEINNTDAEGRLTLGDAITYVRAKVQPDELYDFATLTGACMVALGPYTAGVLSDHDRLVKGFLDAADRAGEDMWRLPLNPRLREQLKSNIADMRNTGDRFGGAITAGLFLKTFAKDTPWVHVDIAGPASLTSPRPSQPRGGTGFAVATIVEHLTK
jgi:leucyl aminopeptidase